METVMSGPNKEDGYYRGLLPDSRSALSIAITLATSIAMWLLVYLIAAIGPAPQPTQPYSGLLTTHFAREAAQR